MKRCSTCKITKILDEFSADKRSSDGHRERCKKCHADYCRMAYKNGPKRARIRVERITCTSCKTNKSYDAFYTDNRRLSGRQSQCKDCQKSAIKRIARKDPAYHLFKAAKTRAKRRGLDFDLRRGDVVIPKRCPVLGIPLKSGDGKPSDNSPTIDRIDSSRGYTSDNIAVISWRANTIKSNATPDEIRKLHEWLSSMD